ncbi:MAG: hypothetical protein A2V77_15385 [Anaeromyxobacter sp. RBG_16_69_14]|nr:MAG: hypothetical protein A2V77_15385 [Anaeromyxobacter sp. RBG_16_69_14]
MSNIGASRLDVVPIHASPEANAALGNAARASLDEEIGELRSDLASRFPERREVIEGALAAVLAREHALFIGPPDP